MTYNELKEKCIYIRSGIFIAGLISAWIFSSFILFFLSVVLISFTANEICPVCDYIKENTNYLEDSDK